MPFDEKGFAEKLHKDVSMLKSDLDTLKSLNADQRKAVMQRVLNLQIDIPKMPEFVEAWVFGFLINSMEGFIKQQFSGKE